MPAEPTINSGTTKIDSTKLASEFGGGLVSEPIAIVSMACKLPGADDVSGFWDFLAQGKSAVGTLPESIVQRELFLDTDRKRRATTYSDIGAIVNRDAIDIASMNLSAVEAADWDECHLRFAKVAQTAWQQFLSNDANADSMQQLRNGRCGVYVGHSGGANDSGEFVYATMAGMTASFLEDCAEFQTLPASTRTALTEAFKSSMQAGRPDRIRGEAPILDANAIARLTSKILGIAGPNVVIESACASSLVALGLASVALNAGQIDAAIVGGASYNKVDSLILFSQAQSCSATDSKPFDDDADGLISSEGFVAIVVKRLADAVRDGDKIEAVISGIGMASDGRGKSLWAPRREGQMESMRRAYHDADQLRRLQYIEAHATSTQVGDATETTALADFFRPLLGNQRLPIGSVKSNIGHTLETAGLAGLLKTVLAMQHDTIPPSINYRKPNTRVDWTSVPFDIVTESRRWPATKAGATKTAAVNAFGIGGLNVHVVLEAYDRKVHQSSSELKSIRPASSTSSVRNTSSAQHNRAGNSNEPIAVIGLGCVLPGAMTYAALPELLASNQSHLQSPSANRWPTALPHRFDGMSMDVQGGYIDQFEFDWRGNRIPPKQVQNANPLQFMLLQAAGEAMQAAGILNDQTLLQRSGVVVGTVFGGDFSHGLQIGLRLQAALAELELACKRSSLCAAQVSQLKQQFEAALLKRLPALLDETGSFTSSTLASRITKHFNLMGGAFALDAAGQSSAHAMNVAMQMLRTGAVDTMLCAAGVRNLDYHAFLRFHHGGFLPTVSNSPKTIWPGEGVVAVALQRLSTAKARGAKILGLIDSVDFQYAIDRPQQLAADGSTAVDQSLMSLERRIGRLSSSESLLGVAVEIASASPAAAVHRSGNQTALVMASQLHHECINKTLSTVRFAAGECLPPLDQTTSRIHHQGSAPKMNRPIKQPDATASPPTRTVTDSALKPQLVSTRRLGTVGAFPGQGSQSPSMLQSPALQNESAQAILAQADEILGSLGSDNFQILLGKTSGPAAESIWAIQATMLISDVAYFAALQSSGVRLDAVIGHSLGELAALVVSEAWTLADALKFVQARAQVVVSTVAQTASGLVSIAADNTTVRKLIESSLSTLAITHINTAKQTVVGGSTADLDRLLETCCGQRLSAIKLDVPAAFHSSIMSAARWELMSAANAASIMPPKIPMLSTVTGQFVADPQQIRQNLVDQLITPIDYVRDIARLEALHIDRVLEVGPGSILTKMNRANIADPSIEIVAADQLFAPTTKSANQAASAPAAMPAINEKPAQRSRLIDATASRRSQMRAKASEKKLPVNGDLRPASSVTTPTSKSAPATAAQPASRELTTTTRPEIALVVSEPQFTREQLQQFIIDFIVEHTGYPIEMIDPTWDLEADLGVDSIKQVQMFGELRTTFDLDTSRFRGISVKSIIDICDVIIAMQSEDALGSETSDFDVQPATKPALLTNAKPMASFSGIQIAIPVAKSTPLDDSSPAQPQTVRYTASAPMITVQSLVPSEIASPVTTILKSSPTTEISTVSEKILGQFMVDFIVEHTGYPPEMVDLNAELESDLGIDSIKLAQLIGEVRSSFNFDLSLEDRRAFIACKSLQDIIDHLLTKEILPEQVSDSQLRELEAMVLQPIAVTANVTATKSYLSSGTAEVAVQTMPPKPVKIGKLPNGKSFSRLQRFRDAISKSNSFRTEAEFRKSSRQINGATINDLLPSDATEPAAQVPSQSAVATAESNIVQDNPITQRYILRTISKPPQEAVGVPRFFGRAVVVGENAIADELVQRLDEAGVQSLRLLDRDAANWPQLLSQAWDESPLPHLFITSPHDENATARLDWQWMQSRRAQGIDSIFWLAQRWMNRVLESCMIQECTLVATPNLGGDFGFCKPATAIEGGAIAGMVKAIIIECWMAGHRRLNFKLIDLASDLASKQAVESILGELSYGSYDTEIAYDKSGRKVVRAIAEPCGLADPAQIPQPGDIWLCTGGARGITAYVAEQLAKRYQLRLNLVGVTKQIDIPDQWRNLDEAGLRALKMATMQQARDNPNHYDGRNPLKVWQDVEKAMEIDETLQRMRTAGIDVQYHSCDCADREALDAIIAKINLNQGPVSGILHGAGIGQDSRFDRKLPLKVDQCFSAKLNGPLALMQAAEGQPLKHFIGFGSISGRFGANGHTDYSAANEGLSKIVGWYRHQRPSVRSIAFHWHAWGDIGMATKPETKLALESIGMQFMPAAEGLAHLIAELESSPTEHEVLITDDRYHRAFYPAESVEAECLAKSRDQQHALIDLTTLHSKIDDASVQQLVRAELLPTKDPFLVEHRLKDRPLLPIVVDLELIVEAAMEHAKNVCLRQPAKSSKKAPKESAQPLKFASLYPVQLTDVNVIAPLKFFCDAAHTVQIQTDQQSKSTSFNACLTANTLNRAGQVVARDRSLCTANVHLNAAVSKSVGPAIDHRGADLVWYRPTYTQPTDLFYSGAPFRLLHRFAIEGAMIVAEMTAPSLVELSGIDRNATGWRVPSAVIDATLYAAGILAWQVVRPSVCLPVGFDALTINALPRPGQRLTASIVLTKQSDDQVCFDFDVSSDEGMAYIVARGYQATFVQP